MMTEKITIEGVNVSFEIPFAPDSSINNFNNSFADQKQDDLEIALIKSIINRLDIDSGTDIRIIPHMNEHGGNTVFLYSVIYENQEFFVKGERFDYTRQFDKIANFIDTNCSELREIVNLPFIFTSFCDQDNNHYFYSISKRADGISLYELEQSVARGEHDYEVLEFAYFKFGQAIATMHLAGAVDKSVSELSQLKTHIVHHDLHPGQVFFDGERITVIDNISLELSTDYPMTTSGDIRHFVCYEDDALKKQVVNGYVSEMKNIECIDYIKNEFLTEIYEKCIANGFQMSATAVSKYTDELLGEALEVSELGYYGRGFELAGSSVVTDGVAEA